MDSVVIADVIRSGGWAQAGGSGAPIPGGLDVGGLGAADHADHPGMYVGEPGGQALSA